MADDTVVNAVLNWVNSFDSIRAIRHCSSLSDLSDGRMCLSMLSEIAPAHFEASAFGEPVAGGNWALSAANIKRLVRMIDEYYRSVLHKQVSNINSIDATAIGKASDVDELLSLVELVVGVAVMCDNRAAFIQKIFSLDSVSQSALKHVVEQVISRTESLADAESEEHAGRPPSAAAPHHLEEMISHLQNERLQHVQQINSLQRNNDELAALSQSLKAKIAQFESEKEDLDNTAAQRGKLQETKAVKLQHELNDVQRELDLKSVACDTMRSDMAQLRQKLEAASQGMAKLEMESHQLSDELDVARDKAAKLAKAEAQIDKYQRRIEELATVKQENKELVDKLDQYMDKIHDLESSNKNIATMNKMIEQYKDKAVEMEREKFQAVSALQMHQHEFDRMVRELEDAMDGKRFLEEELAGVRAELEQHMAVAAELNSTYYTTGDADSSGDNGGRDRGSAFETESAATLREKVKLLEIELRDLRASSGGGEVGSEQDAGAGPSSSRSASASALRELTSELAMVKAELQIASSVKAERDEMLISSKKAVSELQLELQKSNRACAELEKSVQKGTAAAAVLKDTEQKLAMCENTLRLLEANMKEKEGLVSRLEQDKSKLETFSKSTLLAFKEKYMKALKGINDEKKSLEERLAVMIETNERNQVTSRREEHLMLSALYEVGVKIMDRNIEAKFGPTASLATPHKSAASDLL